MPDANDLMTFNGVNGTTGEYLMEPMPVEEFASLLASSPRKPGDSDHLKELKLRAKSDSESQLGLTERLDPKDLGQAGWGVIFAADADADQAIYKTLSPLLELRKGQAGELYREYIGVNGYKAANSTTPAENKRDFLARWGVGWGPVNPKQLPYYLLIVGDPDSIPFRFQYQMGLDYAVGRIHFDSVADYAAYARSVVEAETGPLALEKRAAFFGTLNNGDGATRLSHDELVVPLAQWAAAQDGWKVDPGLFVNGNATKANLAALLKSDAPAFLFTASHGMGYSEGDAKQLPDQGALLCQDWPGHGHGPVSDDFFFGGNDVADSRVFGMVAMHFACFGAGTPQVSDFSSPQMPAARAPKSFVGRLPQRLLSHPNGGALAVIGHVDLAWPSSFHLDKAGGQTEVFKSTITRLMDGHPVGSALDPFSRRYASLSSDLTDLQRDARDGVTVDPYLLGWMWTATNDARSYAIVGDPAVRLKFSDASRPVQRPTLEVIPMPVPPAVPTPSAPQPPQVAAVQVVPEMMPYGVFDDTAVALQSAAKKIGAWLADSFQTVTTVQVSTYVSDGTNAVQYENGGFPGAQLRAVTVASLDGNTKVCVPETDGKVDDALWKIHADIVDKALTNRIELLKTAATAIASLVPGVKAL